MRNWSLGSADELEPDPGAGTRAPHSILACRGPLEPPPRELSLRLIFLDDERDNTLGGALKGVGDGHGSSRGRPPKGGGMLLVPRPTWVRIVLRFVEDSFSTWCRSCWKLILLIPALAVVELNDHM